jgi:predicted N-acetyltransferase YhbS
MTINYQVLTTVVEKERHKQEVMSLFQRAFGRPLIENDWRHFIIESPYEPGRCVVALDGDRVVGTANLIPQRLMIDGRRHDYFLFTTSMVDPDYRKQGVYLDTTRLAIEAARDAGKSFILAFPNEIAFRPLTVFFPFRPFGDFDLISAPIEEIGLIRPVDLRRSICLDDDFIRWRFNHRPYLQVRRGDVLLVGKPYGDGLDVAEAIETPPEALVTRLPRNDLLGVRNAHLLAARCTSPGAGRVMTRLRATCCALQKDIDLGGIDVSLLMWDVV